MGKIQVNTDPGNPGVSLTWGEKESKYGTGEIQSNLAPVKSGNQMYDALFNANPYNNLTYNRSGWQDFLSSLGFRTDFDRWKEEQQVNKNEYDAQVASIMQQNKFNSPEEMASRMRDAGLNPDLLGTNGVAESASPVQDVNGMSPNSADDFEKVQQFGGAILNLCQVGFGLAKDLMTFKQMSNALNDQDFDLAKKFMTFANDYVIQNAPPEPFNNEKSFREYTDKMINNLVNIGYDFTRTRRQRKLWAEVVNPKFYNSETFKNITSNWLKSGQNMQEISRLDKPFSFRNRQPWSAFDDVSQELGRFANQAYKAMKRSQTMQESYNADYYQTLNPIENAKAQNEVAMQTWQSANIDRLMNQTMQKIVNKLSRDAQGGDMLASGLLLAMQIFRMSRFSFGSKGWSMMPGF